MSSGRGRDRSRPRDTIPQRIDRERTERLATEQLAQELLTHVREIGASVPERPRRSTMEPAEFIDQLAARLQGTRAALAGPHKRTFLGLDGGSWTRIAVGYIVAATVAIGGWYLTVRDGLHSAATHEQVEEAIERAVDRHNGGLHPAAEKEIEVLKAEQQAIRESQIRQEALDEEQTRILGEIKDDVKRLRRR